MGIEVSPQGIMTALIVAAFAIMAYVNRDKLNGLFPPNKGEEKPNKGEEKRPWVIDLGPDEAVEMIPMHVLDVMKTLTAINERDQLGCEDELKAIYAKIVSRKPESPKT